jgi:hypothetical protein
MATRFHLHDVPSYLGLSGTFPYAKPGSPHSRIYSRHSFGFEWPKADARIAPLASRPGIKLHLR